jgi:hypothetical protein
MARSMDIQQLISSLTSPLTAFRWEFFIPNLPAGGDIDAIRLRCHTAALPNVASEAITIDWRAMRFRVAGKLNFSHTMTLNFYDNSDTNVITAFYNWRQMITSHTDGTGSDPATYKTDCYLDLLDPAGNELLEVQLLGCYPEDVQEVALDMSNNALISLNVVMSYDRWIIDGAVGN